MFEPETKPDFVNDLGVKYWVHKDLSSYCKRMKVKGIAYKVKLVNGEMTYVIVGDKGILTEAANYQNMLYRIDALSFTRRRK